MSLRVFGIASCDACRKARRWLDDQAISYEWVDLREQPPAEAVVKRWVSGVGGQRLVNRRSTTWRELDPAHRPAPDADDLSETLRSHPTLIKRPVFDVGDDVRVGFDDETRAWLTSA